jgi:excisionase family DNA binding protein
MSLADLLGEGRRSWLSVPEVSRLLELDPSTVREVIKAGKMPGVQPTGERGPWRIPIDQLERHLRANGYQPDHIRQLRATWQGWLAAQEQ